ncbi:hypothetical protein AJ79_04794 [Helicocarpus griseus UAMH5409]|uniref:Uncharacterized protein n=1 Tax=Helicocarpus griseus UAMH5409 TaxID=1447875 RepID=A0A2B7XSS8_9EURO|nr:hypothetical protein AJ79_04794 [Helicocarpus griseus UAMH5409]
MLYKSRLPQTLRLSLRSPARLQTKLSATSVRYRWTGSKEKEHSLDRSKRGDTTTPITEGTTGGIKEREEAEKGVPDNKAKSQATTEQNHSDTKKKAQKEYPEAPKPVIGMTDERGKHMADVVLSTAMQKGA